MSVATATANFNLDLAIMIRSGDRQIVIVANGIDFAAIGLALLRWFLSGMTVVFDAILGWTDIPLMRAGIVATWFKNILLGVIEELWRISSRRKMSV